MTVSTDLYERHRQAVDKWRSACMTVSAAERDREEARAELDKAGDDLLASCANSKPAKQVRRKRMPKVNGGLIENARFAELTTKPVKY